MSNFQDRKNSSFCLGFDPRADFLSSSFFAKEFQDRGPQDFWPSALERILKVYETRITAVKFQSAFFESMGSLSFTTLKKCIDLTRSYYNDLEIILDYKRSDIGTTLDAYLEFAFSTLAVDTVTLVPYYGKTTLKKWKDSHFKNQSVFLVAVGTELEEQLAQFTFISDVLSRSKGLLDQNLGLVVGANIAPSILSSETFDQLFRCHRWLIPGVGAQGSSYADTVTRLKPPAGSLISSSRQATALDGKSSPLSWEDYELILRQRLLAL